MKQVQSVVEVRIRRVAFDLFYRRGYRAVGINEIIREAGVAKASFYQHFPSKDALFLAYAREKLESESARLRMAAESWRDPVRRFYAALNVLSPWLRSTRFRGCPFLLMRMDAPPELLEVPEICASHRKKLLVLLTDLTNGLADSDVRYKSLDIHSVAHAYLLLFEGAMAAAVTTRSVEPVERAIRALEQLINSPREK